MKRLKLVVAYDGTNYHGFAKQKNAISIQGMLEQAITAITKQKIEVVGAGRTDAGVHARAQCCIIDIDTNISPSKLPYALNSKLPLDIRIIACEEVAPDFHPRFDTKHKTYRYSIHNAPFMDPFHYKYAMHHGQPLDIVAMQEAANFLIGTHDFKSFCSTKTTVQSTVRTIFSLKVHRVDEMIYIDVCGDGFLYNMVRIIAGTLLQVGQHRRKPDSIQEALVTLERTAAGPTAEAKGLMMYEIYYPDNAKKVDIN